MKGWMWLLSGLVILTVSFALGFGPHVLLQEVSFENGFQRFSWNCF